MTALQPVILSGGAGTRLWPLSREMYPKQFLSLAGKETMFQQTVKRGESAVNTEVRPPLVVCNEEHRFLVAEQLRQLGVTSAGILLEPVGRNTAPALTIASIDILARGEDAVMLVVPADHVIRDLAAFSRAVKEAQELAESEFIVTFGIVPTAPETGYGYIKKGKDISRDTTNEATASAIALFVEKPNAETARTYLDSGNYLWNSGMFVVKASSWLAAVKQLNPKIYESCEASYKAGRQDQDFFRVNQELFTDCPADSIDYAVMEKLSGDENVSRSISAAVVPLEAGWSDIGAWSALWDVEEKDDAGNVVQGDVLTTDTRNSFLLTSGRLLAAVGVDDLVVVETPDAVLVADKKRVQDVKAIVQNLKSTGREEFRNNRRVHRPWGTYETIDIGKRYQVKRITVNAGAALSLQMHHHRAEHWVVVSGTAKVTRGEDEFLVTENESTYIPLGTKHRLENPGKFPLEMIEVQSGTYLGEDDIVRFDDNYGR